MLKSYSHFAFHLHQWFLFLKREFLEFHQTLGGSEAIDEDWQHVGYVEQRTLNAVDELGVSHEHTNRYDTCMNLMESPSQTNQEGA